MRAYVCVRVCARVCAYARMRVCARMRVTWAHDIGVASRWIALKRSKLA